MATKNSSSSSSSSGCPALPIPNNLFQGTFVCYEHGKWSTLQRIVAVCTSGETRIEAKDIKQPARVVFTMCLRDINDIVRCERGSGAGSGVLRISGACVESDGRIKKCTRDLGFLNAIERENFCMLVMLLKPRIVVRNEGEIFVEPGVRLFHARLFQRYSSETQITLLIDNVRGLFGVCTNAHASKVSDCEPVFQWHNLTLYAPPSKRRHLQIWRKTKLVFDLAFSSVVHKQHFVGSYVNLRGKNRSYLFSKRATALRDPPAECKPLSILEEMSPRIKSAQIKAARSPLLDGGVRGSAHHHVFTRDSLRIERAAMQEAKRASTIWLDDMSWYIFTTTLNCGGKKPPSPGSLPFLRWIPPKSYDIYAIALQECKHRDEWFQSLLQHVDGHTKKGGALSGEDDYVMISHISMMNIHLVVFARERAMGRGLLPLGTSSRPMGFAHMIGNKGSVCASFVLSETTRICFVGSHFAARADPKRLKKREKNYVESVAHLQTDVKNQLLHSYDHVFWLGDFNYRVNLGQHGTPDEFGKVKHLIAHQQFDLLTSHDQLRIAMKNESVFYGFSEGNIDFAPTYRMEPGATGQVYGNKRFQNPSYCDRVLFRSSQGLEDMLSIKSYRPCWAMNRGDHRPVVATFTLVNRTLHSISERITRRRLETGAIHIMDLKVRVASKVLPDSKAKVRVSFAGEVLRENVETSALVGGVVDDDSSLLSLHWSSQEIPLLSTWTVDAAFLAREHVQLCVGCVESGTMGLSSHWKLCAEAELWLGPIVNRFPIGSEAKYELPLVRGGQKVGSVSMRVWYVQMADHRSSGELSLERRHSETSSATSRGFRAGNLRVSKSTGSGSDSKRRFSSSADVLIPLAASKGSMTDLVTPRSKRLMSEGLSHHQLDDVAIRSPHPTSPMSPIVEEAAGSASMRRRARKSSNLKPSVPSLRSLVESRGDYPLLVPSFPRDVPASPPPSTPTPPSDESAAEYDKKSQLLRRIIDTQQNSVKLFLTNMMAKKAAGASLPVGEPSPTHSVSSTNTFFTATPPPPSSMPPPGSLAAIHMASGAYDSTSPVPLRNAVVEKPMDASATAMEIARVRPERTVTSRTTPLTTNSTTTTTSRAHDVSEMSAIRRASMGKIVVLSALSGSSPSHNATPLGSRLSSVRWKSRTPSPPQSNRLSNVARLTRSLEEKTKTSISQKRSSRPRRSRRRIVVPSRRAVNGLKDSEDPVDKLLLRVHSRKDPINWGTFAVIKGKPKSRTRRGAISAYRLEINASGEGRDLQALVSSLCAMPLSVGVARVVIRGSSKYVILSYASGSVGGIDIFRMKALKKALKAKFGAFHADIHGREAGVFDPREIRRRLS